MKKGYGLLFGLGVLFLILLVGGCGVVRRYNALVVQDEAIEGAWSQVENQLERRSDLIPNLVETVKGFATQERTVFENIAEARSKLAGASTPGQAAAADAELTSALSRLLVVVENYPELKSNENFIRLQDELAGTENRIAVERKRYNDVVQAFNTGLRRFPDNFLGSWFGFEEHEYFAAEEAAKQPPKVAF